MEGGLGGAGGGVCVPLQGGVRVVRVSAGPAPAPARPLPLLLAAVAPGVGGLVGGAGALGGAQLLAQLSGGHRVPLTDLPAQGVL